MTGSKQTATHTNQTESVGEQMVHLVKAFKVNKNNAELCRTYNVI